MRGTIEVKVPLMCSLVIVSVEGKRGGAGAGRAEAAAAERLHEVVIGSGVRRGSRSYLPAMAELVDRSSWLAAACSHRRWRLRSFFVAALSMRPVCAASLRGTARVSPMQVGRPEMHDDRVMCAFVPLDGAHLVIGERVGSVFVDAPVEWATRHAQEPCAIRVGPLEAARTPQWRRFRCHELLVVEHGGQRTVHGHLKVAPDVVDVEPNHVRGVAGEARWLRRASRRPRNGSEQSRT